MGCVAHSSSKALVWVVRSGGPGVEVLLLRRPGRRGGGFHPVTGKAHAGEPAPTAAAREAEEETGLTGKLVDLKWVHEFTGPKGRHIREHGFLLEVEAASRVRISDEHEDFAWMPPEKARSSLTWPAHREALDLALQQFGKG